MHLIAADLVQAGVWAGLVWGLVWLMVAGVGMDVVGMVWLGLLLELEWVVLVLGLALLALAMVWSALA